MAALRRAAERKAGGAAVDPRIRHFRDHYVEFPNLPTWVAVASFGDLSRLYNGLRPRCQKPLAASFGLHSPGILQSWLHNLTQVRNQCAHQGRLWGFRFPARVSFPDAWPQTPQPGSLYASLLCTYDLMRGWAPRTAASWRNDVVTLIAAFLAQCPLGIEFAAHMGLPPDWDSHPVWHVPRAL